MKIYTLKEILNNPWNNIIKEEVNPGRTPDKWLAPSPLTIDDVKNWEEIFYKKGVIGVYAAWDPYEDFYIIVHNFYLDKKYIESFTGPTSVNEVIERCASFGIHLPVREIFVTN